jgi:hypothetical protein
MRAEKTAKQQCQSINPPRANLTSDYSLPTTIEEAKKNALDYLKKEVPQAQAEMVSAQLQDTKWLVAFSWPGQKKKEGTQFANLTVSDSGQVEAYSKTSSPANQNTTTQYHVGDFVPLVVSFVVSAIMLVLTIAIATSISLQIFSTVIFFLFLFIVLSFLYAMKWMMWDKDYGDAFGLPPGSIRTVIALSVVFFALFVGIFKLSVPDDIVTLLAALVAFYFGATTAKAKTNGGAQTGGSGSGGGATP